MFFSIAQQYKDNFSKFYELGSFKISTDAGWTEFKQDGHSVLYKGYADSDKLASLLDQIISQKEPEFLGNFCALVYSVKSGTLRIQTDRYRSFPIYFDATQITNLFRLDNTAWTDSLIEINTDLTVVESKFDVIGPIDITPTTVDDAVNRINIILEEKTQKFIRYVDRPIKTFISGGVDSLLVYSYLQRYTDNFELIKGQHIDYDEFWLKNSGTLRTLWGYTQIHHWNDPCVLTSGAPGDEFMLRSPVTVDLFLKLQDRSMITLLNQDRWKGCLHQTYFNLPKHYTIFADDGVLPVWNREQMMWNLCNILLNDWQHWHLGNTLTWTPLRDLEIIKLLLRLPVDDALGQIMNSDISCRLIEQNKSGLTGVISDQKNAGNSMKNLVNFYFKASENSTQ